MIFQGTDEPSFPGCSSSSGWHPARGEKAVIAATPTPARMKNRQPCGERPRRRKRQYYYHPSHYDGGSNTIGNVFLPLLLVVLVAIHHDAPPPYLLTSCLAFQPVPVIQKQQQQQSSAQLRRNKSNASGNATPTTTSSLFLAYSSATGKTSSTGGWFPQTSSTYDDDISALSDARAELEERAVRLTANLIRHRLLHLQKNCSRIDDNNVDDNEDELLVLPKRVEGDGDDDVDHQNQLRERTLRLVRGRFHDLTGTLAGEVALERLFWDDDDDAHHPAATEMWQEASEAAAATGFAEEDAIRAAVLVVQSLCVMATQVGVKGAPQQLRRAKAHLMVNDDDSGNNNKSTDLEEWNNDSIRRLKYNLDRTPALQLMAELLLKRTPQGVFDLLVQLGAWEKHEDLALLRSGFPIRFTAAEEQAASHALQQRMVQEDDDSSDDLDFIADTDTRLGLRQDLRHHKVYTIDSVSTSEIDDGLSVEVIEEETSDGEKRRRHRIWIHIADADRWAPRDSELFEAARRRITSLYLPRGSIPMFPAKVSTEVMSLNVNEDVCALSMGVELNDDGSIDKSSLVVTPSLIRVAYRLSYDEVDEMLEEGIAYNEEWQLGALLAAATKRREFRVRNGSLEGVVPNPVPFCSVSTFSDKHSPDGIGISVNIEVSHNAAKNKTATAEDGAASTSNAPSVNEEPVSSANLLVTESMIMAGEAIGRWKAAMDLEEESRRQAGSVKFENGLRLPFRSQRRPDFKARSQEKRVMMELLEYGVGHGFCHAWYARRFLESVSVVETVLPHSGLGLECYVQWSSPIRRFSDLQVHSSVKRYLRRRKVYELLENGQTIPTGVTALDLGVPDDVVGSDGTVTVDSITADMLDQDVNYLEGVGLIGAARTLQRQSQQYWLFEYIRRQYVTDPDTIYNAIILGCVDPAKQQYAIYVKELGLEHRYSSPGKRLNIGATMKMKVANVSPRAAILSFVRIV